MESYYSKHTKWAVLGTFLLACVGEASFGDVQVNSSSANDRAAQLRQLVLDRKSLDSFQIQYSLFHIDAIGNEVFHENREYLFDGTNRLLRIYLAENRLAARASALFNGNITTRAEQCSITGGTINRNNWPEPLGAEVSPFELYGEIMGDSMSEILSDGESYFFEKNGIRILSHRNSELQTCVDIYFSDDNLITQIDWVMRPDISFEQLRKSYDGNLFEVRWLNTTLELYNYVHIKGVDFPTFAIKTWWRPSNELIDMINAGQMKLSEVEKWSFAKNMSEFVGQQTVDVDVENLSINEPIAPSAFSLQFPEGAFVQDEQTGILYRVDVFGKGFTGQIRRSLQTWIGDGLADISGPIALHFPEEACLTVQSDKPLPWGNIVVYSGTAATFLLSSLLLTIHLRRDVKARASLDPTLEGSGHRE